MSNVIHLYVVSAVHCTLAHVDVRHVTLTAGNYVCTTLYVCCSCTLAHLGMQHVTPTASNYVCMLQLSSIQKIWTSSGWRLQKANLPSSSSSSSRISSQHCRSRQAKSREAATKDLWTMQGTALMTQQLQVGPQMVQQSEPGVQYCVARMFPGARQFPRSAATSTQQSAFAAMSLRLSMQVSTQSVECPSQSPVLAFQGSQAALCIPGTATLMSQVGPLPFPMWGAHHLLHLDTCSCAE